MLSCRPLYDWILGEEILEAEEKGKKGIIIPDLSQMSFQRFKVLRVGSGRPILDGKLLPLEVRPGDTVLVRSDILKSKGIAIRHDGRLVTLFKEELVIAIEEEN